MSMLAKDNSRVFSRRAFITGALQGSVLCILGGRLAWLQIAQGQRYKMLSDKNRIDTKMLAPSRGKIFDRFGLPLAVNDQNFRVLLVPEQTKDIERSLRNLQSYIDLDEAEIKGALERAGRVAKFSSVEVTDGLSWSEVSKIEVNLLDLPGLSIDVGEIRNYPNGVSSAHIVGYVGAVNRSELGQAPVLSLPGFKIGKTGIEKRYDREMRGEPGSSEVEVNVSGREVQELHRIDSRSGQNIVLSIDARLQNFTQEILAREKSASAVIMDVHTGAVYALASHPAFDPNDFTRGLSPSMWEGLLADPGHPLTNKAIAGQYPPASTFKMVTALAGLRAGKVTQGRTSYCPGYYKYGKDKFHCWKRGGHGTINLEQALAQSCDVYFYELAIEIGIEKIAHAARDLGLGQKLGFDLPQERPGLVPDKNWKMGHIGKIWRPGETIISSIGQGYLLATPLQLAVMTSRLVNGGYAVKPWITGYIGVQAQAPLQEKSWPKMDIHPWHATLIKRGMDAVVNHKRGTAFASRIEEEGLFMGGKTGTAQVKKITTEQRRLGVKNEDLPWIQRHHALFVGYAPLNNPRYACAVVVEHGIGGSKTAAPIAKELLIKVQQLNTADSTLLPKLTKES